MNATEQPNSQDLEQKVIALTTELNSLRVLISAGLQKVENNFEILHNDTRLIHKRLEVLTKEVENLGSSTNDGFDDVGTKIESLTEEISKIGEVTSYKDQFKNMKGINLS